MLLYIAVHPQHTKNQREAKASTKTATLTFRIEPELKEALRAAAEREHRSIAIRVAVRIREHCARQGIEIPVAGDLSETRPGQVKSSQ